MTDEISTLIAQGALWPARAEEQSGRAVQEKPGNAVPFSLPAIDNALSDGGLSSGSLHEWFFDSEQSFPPGMLLSFLSGNALRKHFEQFSSKQKQKGFTKFSFWIGRDVWPTPYALVQTMKTGSEDKSYLSNCIFLEPQTGREKFLTTLAVLQCPAVSSVVVSFERLKFSQTRQLALAAERGNSLAFVVRKLKELSLSSTAQTRWRVDPYPAGHGSFAFTLELLKTKGKQLRQTVWGIEFKDGEGYETLSLHLSSDMVSGSRPEKDLRRAAL